MSAVRLPEMWWNCACSVVDKHDNEWIEYVEVLASTKSEAYSLADAACSRKGLALFSAQVLAMPEKKVLPKKDEVLALPPPPPPKQEAARVTEFKPPVDPNFPIAFFTKYTDTARIVYKTEEL